MGSGIAAAARDAGLKVLLVRPRSGRRRRGAGRARAVRPRDRGGTGGPRRSSRSCSARSRSTSRPTRCSPRTPRPCSVSAIAAGVPGPERVVGLHFFNPPAHEAGRAGRGRRQLRGGAGARTRGRRGDGQARDPRRRRAGLHRQPLQPPVLARGAADRAGGPGDAGAGRPHLPLGRRLPDGPVRADGPRRDRRRLRGQPLVLRADAGAALAPSPWPRGWRRAGRHGRKTGAGWYAYPGGPAARTRPRRSRATAAAGCWWWRARASTRSG